MIDYSKKYYRRAKRVATWMKRLPFVRCIILNGSVAEGKAVRSSDIDFLIVAKEGRIFTCRFFCVGLIKILGLKRPRNEEDPHPGKFCLNYFMTEKHLTIPHHREEAINRYCAVNYSHSKFLAGDSRLFKHYIQCNTDWWRRYGYDVQLSKYKAKRHNYLFNGLLEILLGGGFERKLKAWQMRKIEKDNLFKIYPDLIACNDVELRFHPPKEK